MSKNQNPTSILASEKWVVQRCTRRFRRGGQLFESWTTLTRPLKLDQASARAARLAHHKNDHRLLSGVPECFALFSKIVEVAA